MRDRLFRWRRFALGGGLLALIPAAWVLDQVAASVAGTGCLFQNLAGRPCAFCGLTRSVGRALDGDWATAMAFHPLWWLAVLVILTLAVVALRDAMSGTDGFGRVRRVWRGAPWYLIAGILLGASILRAFN